MIFGGVNIHGDINHKFPNFHVDMLENLIVNCKMGRVKLLMALKDLLLFNLF